MGNARRVFRRDESEVGEVVWLSTAVEMGSSGIKGLLHFVGFDQLGWVKEDDAPATSNKLEIYDAVTSRTPTRMDVTATGKHRLVKRVIIPIDFGNFSGDSVALLTRVSSVAVGLTLKLTMFRGGVADLGINAVNVKPLMANTYSFFTFTPLDTYSPGDFVTFELELVSDSIGDTADVADLELTYKNTMGNT